MSYYEAKEDGIPITKAANGMTLYYPPCRFCGKPVQSWSYIRDHRYACPECRKEAVAQERAEKEGAILSKKEKKLEMAIKRISKMTDIEAYTDAITQVRNSIDQQGWYQSTEEIMVALELLRCHVVAHRQVKVFEYTVDFVLPDLKVVLEIDGNPFHRSERRKYEETRDDVIGYKFGSDWDVIHIKTDVLNMNITKLLPAIRAIKANRKKVCTPVH